MIGALRFKRVGVLFSLPLATVLFALAIIPVIDDLRGIDISANA